MKKTRGFGFLAGTLLVLIAINAFADDPIVPPVDETLNKVKSMGTPPRVCPDCITADGNAEKARACDHPFESRCAKVQGNAKEKIDLTGRRIIKDAFDDLVKKSGKVNLGALALEWLKEKGLAPVKPLKADEIKAFGEVLFEQTHGKYNSNSYYKNQDVINKIFRPEELASCSLKTDDIPSISFSCGSGCTTSTKDVRIVSQRYGVFAGKLREGVLATWEDSMAALYRTLQERCDEGNEKVKKFAQCDGAYLLRLRTDIGDAVVDRDKAKAEVIIQQMFDAILPVFVEAFVENEKPSVVPDFTKPISALPKDSKESSVLERGFSRVANESCRYLENILKAPIQMKTSEFMQWAAKSEPVVRYLEKEYYSEDRVKRVENIFNDIKKREIDFLQNKILPKATCLNETQKKQVLSESIALPLVTPKAMPKKYFINVKFGIPSLLREKGTLFPEELEKPEFNPMVGWDLGEFTSYNGYYAQRRTKGIKSDPEYFYLSAGALRATDLNPAPSYQVIAHELGHKFGPRVSKENGYNLRCAYTKLLECFQDLFKIAPIQSDETFADWMAAQITGDLLSSIKDAKEREKQLDLVLLGPCGWEEGVAMAGSLNGVHPPAFIRIDRIFGRNPAIRKSVGCPQKPYCSLDGKVNP